MRLYSKDQPYVTDYNKLGIFLGIFLESFQGFRFLERLLTSLIWRNNSLQGPSLGAD